MLAHRLEVTWQPCQVVAGEPIPQAPRLIDISCILRYPALKYPAVLSFFQYYLLKRSLNTLLEITMIPLSVKRQFYFTTHEILRSIISNPKLKTQRKGVIDCLVCVYQVHIELDDSPSGLYEECRLILSKRRTKEGSIMY